MQIDALCDAAGTFPEQLEVAFPGSGLRGDWRLHVHCFLIRTGTAIVLVDAGTGPTWAPATRWFGRPGRLLDGLATLEVSPADVTHVVLTHLHLDHVGWIVHGPADRPTPTFPRARHVVQRAEVVPKQLGGLYTTHVRPVLDAGLLDVVDGPAEPAPGIALIATPGHTVGHQSVVVETGAERVIISGDVFVHSAQIRDPEIVYAYEDEPASAIDSRRRLLADAGRRPTVLAPAHFDVSLALIEIVDGTARLQVRTSCDEGAD